MQFKRRTDVMHSIAQQIAGPGHEREQSRTTLLLEAHVLYIRLASMHTCQWATGTSVHGPCVETHGCVAAAVCPMSVRAPHSIPHAPALARAIQAETSSVYGRATAATHSKHERAKHAVAVSNTLSALDEQPVCWCLGAHCCALRANTLAQHVSTHAQHTSLCS
jgi:hypothetical protein